MTTSMTGDMGNEMERQAIEKTVVKLITQEVRFTNGRGFWNLVVEEAGATYNITRGANSCERIYRDIWSKNQTLPNERSYIRRIMGEAHQEVEEQLTEHKKQQAESEASSRGLVYPNVKNFYPDPKDAALQQIAIDTMAEMARRENEEAASAEVKKSGAKGKGKEKE